MYINFIKRCDHFREKLRNNRNVIIYIFRMENTFVGSLGCHPVSMQLPKDASLAFINHLLYNVN